MESADEDDLWDAVDCMRENDVLGVPIAMRLGLRLQPGPGSSGGTCGNASAVSLLALAASELAVPHFDVCPLARMAPAPATLAAALEEAGVDSRLRVDSR